MNLQEPLKISSINLENIVFKKTKIIKNKKIIFLKYQTNNFVIQLSKLTNCNILSPNDVEFEINNKESTAFLEDLDNYIIAKLKTNPVWFDNNTEIDYERILKENDTVKLHLFNSDDLHSTVTLNDELINNFNEIDSSEVTAKTIVEIYAISIKNNKVSLILRPINISMKYDVKPVYNYKFIDDTSSEEIIEENSDIETSDSVFIKNNNFISKTGSFSSLSTSTEDQLNKVILG
jgi:hypothetical protein